MEPPNDTPQPPGEEAQRPTPESDPQRAEKWVTPPGGVILEFPDSQCYACVHYNPGGMTCTAFPQGIPLIIWRNQQDHRYPWPGDDGVRFDQDPRKDAFDHRMAKVKLSGGRIIDPSTYGGGE